MGLNLATFYSEVGPGENLLFHYTSFETAKDKIIENNSLRFSPLSNSSDYVEESNFFVKCGVPICQDIHERINSEIQKFIKICCFASEASSMEDDYLPGMMLSRMWCQYAGNQRGVCLVFDKAKLLSNIREQIDAAHVEMQRVKYSQVPHIANNTSSASITLSKTPEDQLQVESNQFPTLFRHPILQNIIFSKMKDFRDEKECRIAIYDPIEGYSMYDYKDALKAIVLGAKISLEESVVKTFAEKGILIYQMKIIATRSITETNFLFPDHDPHYELVKIPNPIDKINL